MAKDDIGDESMAILHRLDERTERIDGQLERMDDRTNRLEGRVDEVETHVKHNSGKIKRNTTILNAMTFGIGSFVAAGWAKINGFLHFL